MNTHVVHTLGRAEITQISELDQWIVNPRAWFPDLTDEQLSHAKQRYPSTLREGDPWRMVSTLSNYVVQLGDLVIVVDTGIGNHKPRPGEPDMNMLETDYQSRFRLAGFDPERVDMVVSTHLHPDHCGWNTSWHSGRWVPTYPNARYLFHGVELDNIRALAAPGSSSGSALFASLYSDSVEPILQQAKWESVSTGDVIAQYGGTTVSLVATPGHTPGHLAVEISDGQRSYLIIGDAFHHPFQLDFRDLQMFADADTPRASRTRAELLERCVREDTRLLTAHFYTRTPVGVQKDADGQLHWTGICTG
ncbi:MBL fold metallo-hydrolase [Mycobacteroides abscessus]|uniref:MBL fold metallo-hydrolase n=1 Tax=Mycobacteroides abscessus TaxID=36809 RepID=UPI0009A6BEA8|nr:MBL fold metallo-hydrolase [Mycobacteroides abscessus]RIT40854.1 MBL fold metallo-hydrolase [Mycobacteroides abscessus]SKT94445.1 beta-lactamase-like protein [Mycobacteroides abscessus subsp. massiliense]SKU20394.1 beta-lactamase-like protein [Mycobacteroides abscessus subsp. massiliense]